MARAIRNKTNVNPPDSDYIFGRVRDDDGSNNGTPVDENLVGDWSQFFEKLMFDAGLPFNGLPDNAYSGFQFIQALQSLIGVRTKVIDIGDWNMDTTLSVSIAHGLTESKIRDVRAFIIPDTGEGASILPIHACDAATTGICFGRAQLDIGGGTITLVRTPSTAVTGFDNTAYNSTGFNRGWIEVDYIF